MCNTCKKSNCNCGSNNHSNKRILATIADIRATIAILNAKINEALQEINYPTLQSSTDRGNVTDNYITFKKIVSELNSEDLSKIYNSLTILQEDEVAKILFNTYVDKLEPTSIELSKDAIEFKVEDILSLAVTDNLAIFTTRVKGLDAVELDDYVTLKQVGENIALNFDKKVDKVEGKSLILDSLITKLQDDYTRVQIDGLVNQLQTNINNGIIQSNAGLIQVTSTVLPQGVDIPSSITSTGVAWLGGGLGGTTYTQTGGASITVPEGSLKLAYYNKTTNLWTEGLQIILPTQVADGVVILGSIRATSGDTVYKALRPLRDITTSINKIDKNLIEVGQRMAASGVLSTTTNHWISIIVDVKPSTTYTLSRFGPTASTAARILFYNNGVFDFNANIYSNGLEDLSPVTFTTGPTHNRIAINITNTLDIGNNPKNNVYANNVQLEEGTTVSDYSPYGFYVDGSRVLGLQNIYAPKAGYDFLKADFDDVTEKRIIQGAQLTNKANNRRGSILMSGAYANTSDNWCCTGLEPCEGGKTYTDSGHSTFNNPNVAIVAFYDENEAFIAGSSIPGTGNSSYTYTAPPNAAFRANTIANAVPIGLNPTDNEYANQFMVNEGTSALPYEPYTGLPPIYEVVIKGDRIINLPDLTVNPDLMYSFNPSLGGHGQMNIFTRMPNSVNEYIGFWVRHEVDMSELVYKDIWRIITAYVYKYENGEMKETSLRAITNGESEFVWQGPSQIDFTGGTHGDETVLDVSFIADGFTLDISQFIPLTECKTFQYVQHSNMHQTAGAGNVVDPNHTVVAIHTKTTEFINGGYTTRNKMDWTTTKNSVMAYHAISCISKDFGTIVKNEFGDQFVFNGDNEFKNERVNSREYHSFSLANNLKAFATSYMITPVEYDNGATAFAWDRPIGDNKYYRKISNKSVVPGDVWECLMSVRFDKL